MDPLNDLATFVLGRLKQGMWEEALRDLFSLIFSGVVSFLQGFSAGIMPCAVGWLSGKDHAMTPAWALVIGLGAGAGWAAVCMAKDFRQLNSKLTKGLTVVLPGAEAALEMSDAFNTQTITKAEGKKSC